MDLTDNDTTQRWQKILQGDAQAFAQFVDQYKDLISSIAYASTGDLQGSEDIAQETFMVAWQSRTELRDPNKLAGWLSSIARNLSKAWIRQRTSKTFPSVSLDVSLDTAEVSQESPDPAERLVTEEEQRMIWGALESVPESYREVLVLYYRQSQSIADVAVALEITEESARQRLSRGRNLLRAEVERKIEAALRSTRLSSSFTASVLSLITAGSINPTGELASTVTAGLLGKVALQSATASVAGAKAGAIVGAAGAILGVLGGLGGTWLGIRVPQLMAPTMTERRLLEQEGKTIWRISLLFSLAILIVVLVSMKFSSSSRSVLYVQIPVLAFSSLAFVVYCIVHGVRLNRKIQKIRREISPEDDPNPTWLKDRIGTGSTPAQSRWEGRRATCARKFLGIPLYDFQVADPVGSMTQTITRPPLHARGWFAVGEKATGLVAIGGYATGFIAIGGRALGVLAFGGLSIGLFTFGGMALGLLSIGGLAIGHSAIGGGAIGWQVAGGLAAGIHSANGGLAISANIAEGGMAISKKFAVGGGAKAPEANTALARSECAKSWLAGYLGSDVVAKQPRGLQLRRQVYFTIIPIALSVIFATSIPLLMYRRKKRDAVLSA